MNKRRARTNKTKIALDRFSRGRGSGRGRPTFVPPGLVRSCADNYRISFERGWHSLEEPLLAARTEQEVADVLRVADIGYQHEISLLAPLIFQITRDPKFPQRKKARINFLADSVAGGGVVTPRRSRDICAEERARDADRHHIIRFEYWIQCSCGYEGHSENHACRKCGAVLYVHNAPGIDPSKNF